VSHQCPDPPERCLFHWTHRLERLLESLESERRAMVASVRRGYAAGQATPERRARARREFCINRTRRARAESELATWRARETG
jgi:hypothetical protein